MTLAFFASAAHAAETYTLRQTFKPGTYYLVMNIDLRQSKDVESEKAAGQASPEMNTQQIWIVKMVIGEPDEKGNKTIAVTYERIQQKTNVGDKTIQEYDSKAPRRQAEITDIFSPLLNANITAVLDKNDDVVSIAGLQGIWDGVQKADPANQSLLEMTKGSFNEEAVKKMILFHRDYLPPQPVAVGAAWTRTQNVPSPSGNAAMDLEMTFAEVEQNAGRTQALIAFAGKTRENVEPATSPADAASKPTMDMQQKGMLRFDLSTQRVSEVNMIQTTTMTLPVMVEGQANHGVSEIKVSIQTAIAMKEYINEIPPELTEPPSTNPTNGNAASPAKE